MAKIDNIHTRIRLYLSKARSGYFNPEEIDAAIFIASKGYYSELLKTFEGSNQISTDLNVFKSNPTPLTLDNLGQSVKPTGFNYVTSLTFGETDKDIDVIDEAFRADRLNDPICPPDAEYPICTIYDEYLQFNPINIDGVKVTFLKEPIAPRWGYILGASNTPIFQQNGGITGDTIDIEWSEDTLNEIELRAIAVLGVNMREEAITQYGEGKQQK